MFFYERGTPVSAVFYEQDTPVITPERTPWRGRRGGRTRPRALRWLVVLLVGSHTVDYDPPIKSQLVSHNRLSSIMWCKFGHVTLQN